MTVKLDEALRKRMEEKGSTDLALETYLSGG